MKYQNRNRNRYWISYWTVTMDHNFGLDPCYLHVCARFAILTSISSFRPVFIAFFAVPFSLFLFFCYLIRNSFFLAFFFVAFAFFLSFLFLFFSFSLCLSHFRFLFKRKKIYLHVLKFRIFRKYVVMMWIFFNYWYL